MIAKQIIFQGQDDRGRVFCDPLIDRFIEKTAAERSKEPHRSRLHPKIKEFVGAVRPTKGGIYVLVNALGSGEYWGSNANGDLFPEKALVHSPPDWDKLSIHAMREVGKKWKYGYPTFLNASPFKHHANKDRSRAFGRVDCSVWNPDMHRVELVVYLDRELCKRFDAYDIIEKIENGGFPDVSMGCKVPYDVCTYCLNESKDKDGKDRCEHIPGWLNKILPDGRKVAMRNDFPRFFDISFVFIGADKTAKVMAKLASKGNQVCMGDFCTIPRASYEIADVYSKEAQLLDSVDHQLQKVAAEGGEKLANDPIKKKLEVQGVPIWLEWLKGETREYKKGKVVKYSRLMKADYGYIPETKDADGEEIDVYLGPDLKSETAYVIKQLKKNTGEFDENKVMIGYDSEKAARDSYDHHMGGTKEFFGGIHAVPVSALRALFSENGDGEEKSKTAGCACDCGGFGSDCDGTTEKLGAALFTPSSRDGEKRASHTKVSDLIKSIPAGPFSKNTLPQLESSERDIPEDVLDLMGGLDLNHALSTPSMMGIVLKPREFQRVMLVHIGEKSLADELDSKGEVFGPSSDVEEPAEIHPSRISHLLQELFQELGLGRDRSAATAKHRPTSSKQAEPSEKHSDEPVLKKLAPAYNGYRQSIIKKANLISQNLVSDAQLSTDVFGGSMAQAFACGVEKTSSSVFGPESLAYLVGAYCTDRDFELSKEAAEVLYALLGNAAEGQA